jgi:hypothetical protein
MKSRAVRRIALALIALLLYAQGSVALAACLMDRGSMAQAAAHDCCDMPDADLGPQLGTGCVAHCTADLQIFELPAKLLSAPADAPVLSVPPADVQSPGLRWMVASPPGSVPQRVLFRKLLI